MVHGRAPLTERAAVVLRGSVELCARLTAVAQESPTALRGRTRPGGTAWIFPGQGAQRLGMGRALHGDEPVFAAAFDEAMAAVQSHLDLDLQSAMWGTDPDALVATQCAQPALFVVEFALAALFTAWMGPPDAVCGHSVGEIAAAVVAGVLTLDEGARLVAARGQAMGALPAGGAMVAVACREADLPDLHEGVWLSAVNTPAALTLSGLEGPLAAAVAVLEARGARCRPLSVSAAFHTPFMEPALQAVQAVARELRPQPPRCRWVPSGPGDPDRADYWLQQIVAPVRWLGALRTLAEHGVVRAIELGPGPGLSRTVPLGADGLTASCALPDDAVDGPARALATMWVDGASLNREGLCARPRGTRPTLPPTPQSPVACVWAMAPERSTATSGLVGTPTLAPGGTRARARWSVASLPWVADHRVNGRIVVPGTALAEAMRRGLDTTSIVDVVLERPVLLPDTAELRTEVVGLGDRVELWVGSVDEGRGPGLPPPGRRLPMGPSRASICRPSPTDVPSRWTSPTCTASSPARDSTTDPPIAAS